VTYPPCPPWSLACRWCHAIRRDLDGALVCDTCDWTPQPAPKETR
jgi:hypothetical protein